MPDPLLIAELEAALAASSDDVVTLRIDALRQLVADVKSVPPTPAELRDLLLREFALAAQALQIDGETADIIAPDRYATAMRAVRDTAQAIAALDAVDARHAAQTQRVADLPVEQLAAAVWQAAQEPDLEIDDLGTRLGNVVGARIRATTFGDVAAAAVRKVLRDA